MKVGLTDNGVMTIYNSSSQSKLQAKVQVIYISQWNNVWFVRVTDSKYLSPVMVITETKGKEKFYVGDIILIKQVDYQPSYFFYDIDEIVPFIDCDLNHIIIKDYDVAEKKSKIGVLYSSMVSSSSDYSYWNDLALIKNCEIILKGDGENVFKEGEKRLELVNKDCNILRERGNDLFNQKNLGKAIIHYEMAKQIDYYDARVWNNSSQAFFSNDEFIKAKKDALIALKLDPFNRKAYYRAGRAMEKAGDFAGATEIIEAGLYLCGKCDDLEKLLQNIKDSGPPKMNNKPTAKKEENQNQNLNLNNSKKKITNGEVIDCVPEPAITNGNIKKNTKPKESPHRKNKETIETKPDNTDLSAESLSQKELRNASLLDAAKLLYKTEKFKNALDLYQAVTISYGNESECTVIRYLIDVCKIKLKMEPLKDVKNSLLSILSDNRFPCPPAIHFWLAEIFEILEDQDKVIYHANSCLHLMQEKSSTPYSLFWPGSNEPILETSPKELKKWFDEGSWRPAPLARCRHKECISIQNHKLATIDIFSSDIDFRGYVEVECEEMCSISFHPGCWKSIKEQSDGGQSGKKAEKDFLGSACLTPDCSGKIVSIRIFDETSQLKNEISKDKKEKKMTTAASKLKKKKDKKKTTNQVGKTEEKKKFRPSDLEDFSKLENDIEIIKEETATIKPNAEEKKKTQKPDEKKKNKTNELDNCFEDEVDSFIHPSTSKQVQEKMTEQVNFEGSNFKVLKPCNSDLDEFNPSQTTKKNKTKKKKKNGKPAQIPIGEEIDDGFAHNEYLIRLRALKSQSHDGEAEPENAWHFNPVPSNSNNKQVPDCVLDPERPFYLPQHLQENPAQLETLLRNKMATANSSNSLDIDKENITTLLEFMYDWLKAEKNPMLITDTRIKDCITENFPSNAVAYVNKCGSIKNFLLQSNHFALIDDVVCVNEHIHAAQDVSIQLVLEKFKGSKFLISDGHQAVKLSHLLDDTKSTCSSNSSMSTTRPPHPVALSEPPLGYQEVNYALSATPYKQAALAKVPHKEPEVKRPAVLENDFIKVGQSKSKQKMTRKPKLKTMDIDVFDDELDMGQLFSQQDKGFKIVGAPSVTNVPKSTELYFHSDEESENNLPALQISNKGKLSQQQQQQHQQQQQQQLHQQQQALQQQLQQQHQQQQQTNLELKERIQILESELGVKSEQVNKLSKEKDLLASKNQELHDRCSQMKVKSSVEIAAWKKSSEDAKEQSKMAETNLECYRNQKEGEVRKLLLEKSRVQEELKTYSLKVDSLQMTLDQHTASKSQFEEKMKQNNLQFAEQQLLMMKYKSGSEAANERAREAETKYLTVKRDLIKLNLEKTKKRLTAEVNKMQELLMDATDMTQPSKGMIKRSLKEWEETIAKLNNTLMAVHEDGQKLVDYIQCGRPLSALPPGDLQIPSVPDLTVAHLLFVGRGTPDLKGADNVTPTSSTIDFLGLNNTRLSSVGSSLHSQFGGLNTFSLGQLGITPNAGTGHGASLQQNELQRSMMGATSGLGLSSSRLGDLGLGIGGHVNRRVPEGPGVSSGFSMNGVSPLSSLFGEDLNKGGSSNSSPIPSSITSMSSLSGASDFTTSYSTEPKNMSSGDHLFGNQRILDHPWSFADSHHIKSMPPKHPSSSVLGPGSDHPLIPSSSTMSSLQSSSSSSSSSLSNALGGSAFGLRSLLDASHKAEPRTVATPTTPTATKPKFQNLRSNDNIGAIGAMPPPKVVRPVPRPGAAASAIGTMPGLQAVTKEEQVISTAAYRKLIEGCKQKFGNEYAATYIQKAIREVREHNKNSLSGLTLETILDQVETQLRMHKRLPPRTSVAPWAQLTQQTQEVGLESQWQGPVRGSLDSISEDHCAICLERLASSPTMPLPCLHEFHIKCIKNWLVRKSDCPICRKFALNNDEFPSLSGHGQ